MESESTPAAETAPRKKVHVWAEEKSRETWHVVVAILDDRALRTTLITEAEFEAVMARLDGIRCG
jgi:hypothetical protein